ncbi:MAG: hypothetical protein FWH40_08700 [Coriobacteriia bacterium]|nr:hypothetical protein [Coriobacteriia bacterium]
MKKLELISPAKLNLALAVSPSISDGKHLLQSVFTTIDLADRLVFEFRDDTEPALNVAMQYGPGIPEASIAQTDNIVYRAVQGFEQRFHFELAGSLTIRVQKSIPLQAGLGGGSSNAAATIKAMLELSGIEANALELQSLAASLGADVAFFLSGGCALMGGHGEVFQRQLVLPRLDLVLVKPRGGLSTALVYQEFTRQEAEREEAERQEAGRLEGGQRSLAGQISPANRAARDIDSLVGLLDGFSAGHVQPHDAVLQIASLMMNNLSPAAEVLLPEISEVIQALDEQPGVLKAMLTGSGSAVFAVAKDREAALAAASIFAGSGYWARACQTSPAE